MPFKSKAQRRKKPKKFNVSFTHVRTPMILSPQLRDIRRWSEKAVENMPGINPLLFESFLRQGHDEWWGRFDLRDVVAVKFLEAIDRLSGQ